MEEQVSPCYILDPKSFPSLLLFLVLYLTKFLKSERSKHKEHNRYLGTGCGAVSVCLTVLQAALGWRTASKAEQLTQQRWSAAPNHCAGGFSQDLPQTVFLSALGRCSGGFLKQNGSRRAFPLILYIRDWTGASVQSPASLTTLPDLYKWWSQSLRLQQLCRTTPSTFKLSLVWVRFKWRATT